MGLLSTLMRERIPFVGMKPPDSDEDAPLVNSDGEVGPNWSENCQHVNADPAEGFCLKETTTVRFVEEDGDFWRVPVCDDHAPDSEE